MQTETKQQPMLDIEMIDQKHSSFILFIEAPGVASKDEFLALFESWYEQFNRPEQLNRLSKFVDVNYASGEVPHRLSIFPKTRRDFALIPLLLRKAKSLDYKIYYQRNDKYVRCYEPQANIEMSENPAIFWQALALAQMWYEK